MNHSSLRYSLYVNILGCLPAAILGAGVICNSSRVCAEGGVIDACESATLLD